MFGLFLLGLGICASTMLAQFPGAFTATGSMTTSRYLPTATLLADGRVLIAGGDMIDAPPFVTQSSAELYDPRSGMFMATGNMMTPRSGGHTATLLPDGRVLITGGGVSSEYDVFGDPSFVSAELYDPDTGTFSATGRMTTARDGSTATLLNNGKVLIAGGARSLGRAELYDPSTGTFAATGDMTSVWADTATLLPNGRVLITRTDQVVPFRSSADLYDPSTGAFTSAGHTIAHHTRPIATLLMNGKVLIAGGDRGDGDGGSNIAELYDPSTGAFSSTGNMTAERERATATLLPDGTVLIASDYSGTDAELYNFATGSFSSTGSMILPRYLHTATLLEDGRVLMAGGDFPSAEIYTPSVLVPAPVLLSLSGDGQGQGAVQHANTYRIASAADPAVAGEYLSIYLTGLVEGSVIPPQVAIGGKAAEITYFSNIPGYPGLNVVNIRMPSGVAPGPVVPVRLTYLGRSSNAVTIGVR